MVKEETFCKLTSVSQLKTNNHYPNLGTVINKSKLHIFIIHIFFKSCLNRNTLLFRNKLHNKYSFRPVLLNSFLEYIRSPKINLKREYRHGNKIYHAYKILGVPPFLHPIIFVYSHIQTCISHSPTTFSSSPPLLNFIKNLHSPITPKLPFHATFKSIHPRTYFIHHRRCRYLRWRRRCRHTNQNHHLDSHQIPFRRQL